MGGAVEAAVITQYVFDGSVDTPSGTAANVTAGNFTPHASLTSASPASPGFSASVPAGGGTNSRFVRTHVTANDQAGSVAANNYFDFTVTAAPSFFLNLTSLTFSLGANGVNTSPATPNTASFFLRSSVDGFAATIGSVQSVSAVDGTTVWSTAGNVDLSAASFQGLNGITFRLYVFDSFDFTPGDFTGVNRLDSVVLNGTVAIPEPSVLGVMTLALAGLGLRRRGR